MSIIILFVVYIYYFYNNNNIQVILVLTINFIADYPASMLFRNTLKKIVDKVLSPNHNRQVLEKVLSFSK